MAVTHSPADRQFYSIEPDAVSKSHFNTPTTAEKEKLLDYVASSIIGKDKTFCGPFGERRAVYLDYIASGRALSFIEDYIQKEVLPEYGNTHTTTSVTSLQTTLFRHEARDIIRNAVNASEHDSVIFTGSGSTGTIHKLIHALNLKEPPVVFVGPFEHHSNLLPWRELASEVVSIRQTKDGVVDICHLEQQLQAFANSGCQLIGSFNAASNVTGILCDVDSITILLHKYGALALWDYATAGPYVRLDMNPVLTGEDSCLVYKDAMFISPHKFMGGVCTPGVLIAKKNLFLSNVPKECGGGTVFFVRREAHRYLHEPELREEGGTPNIVGSIRTGLVFQLKMAITPELIMEKEHSLCRRAIEAWRSVPNLVILGKLQAERLPVFSFLVHHPASGRFLHYNYVSVLLNDLFGIQARGGCACAGPYSMELLGLAEETAAEIEKLLAEDSRLDRVHLRRYTEYSPREIIRPGFTRLNLPYFISEEQLDFVLQAVAMVTEHGWKLLPQYMFNPDTGEWRHKEHQVFKERKWLGHVSYASGHMQYSVPRVSPKAPLPQSFQECLNVAKQLFIKAEKSRFKLADQSLMFDEEARPYRWFLLPSEANQILCGSTPMVPCMPSDLPFCPPELQERWTMGQEMQDVEWTVVNGQTASARSADDSDVWVEAEHGMEEQKSETVIGGKKASCQKEGSSDLHTTSSARLCQDIHSSAEKNTSDNSIQESGGSLPSQVTQSSQPHHPQQSENSHESAASSVDVGADGSASCDGFPHVVQTAMERGYWDNASSCSGPASISLHGDCEVRTVLPHTDPEPVFGPAAAVQEGSAWAPGHRHGDASAERSESTRESLSPKQSPPVLADSDRNCRGEPLTTKTTPSAADATIITGICTLESTRSPKKGADRELHVEEGTSNPGTQQTGSGEHGTESTSNPGTQQAGSGEHGTESTSNPGAQQARSGRKGTKSTSNPGTQQARSGDSNQGMQLARSGRKGRESTSNPGAQQTRSGRKGRESTSNPGVQQTRSGRKGRESTSNPGAQQARSGDSNQGMQQARSGRKGRECGRQWVPPTKEIFKLSVKAMQEYSMIRDGDRVLLCLSGGKDSLSLLHVLHQYQFYCRSQGIHFDLGAVTVDPQTPSYDPSPLKLYLAALGVPYFYESQCIMETAVNLPYKCASICSFCSRMKRGRIYAAARREGYNVLALGQHLDDLAESFIMSLFHNGSLRTMKAHYTVQEGDLRVVRPFVYVREKELRNFAEKSKLPVITENCPACFESPKERHRTKQLLASQEILFPRLYSSILSAIKPVMALSRTRISAASCIAATHPTDDLDSD